MKNIGRHIRQIYRASGTYSQKIIKPLDLSTSEIEALRVIAHHKDMSQQELAVHLAIDKAAVARLAAALEAKGYIIRVKDEKDKRINRLSSTESGDSVKNMIRETEYEFYEWLFHNVEKTDMALFEQVLEAAFEKARAERKSGFKNLLKDDGGMGETI